MENDNTDQEDLVCEYVTDAIKDKLLAGLLPEEDAEIILLPLLEKYQELIVTFSEKERCYFNTVIFTIYGLGLKYNLTEYSSSPEYSLKPISENTSLINLLANKIQIFWLTNVQRAVQMIMPNFADALDSSENRVSLTLEDDADQSVSVDVMVDIEQRELYFDLPQNLVTKLIAVFFDNEENWFNIFELEGDGTSRFYDKDRSLIEERKLNLVTAEGLKGWKVGFPKDLDIKGHQLTLSGRIEDGVILIGVKINDN